MTDFIDLPIKTGYGKWHLNRFRIAFRHPLNNAAQLYALFDQNFPNLLDSPAATVKRYGTNLRFDGKIQLHRKFGLPQPHFDWVRVLDAPVTNGFVVQTMKRTSAAMDDILPAIAGATGGEIVGIGIGGAVAGLPGAVAGDATGGVIGGEFAVDVNRQHFLAGRRAWRLDTAQTFVPQNSSQRFLPTIFILETVAVERFSNWVYNKAEWLLQPAVIPVWCNQLGNFMKQFNAIIAPADQWPLEAGWSVDGPTGVHHIEYSDDEIPIKGLLDFRELARLYLPVTQ